MRLFRTTKEHIKYWTERKADWKTSYLDTWNHPHRKLIVEALKSFPWTSLIEIGCNAGPNLAAIVKALPGKQLGGVDLNPEAIELCQSTFQGGLFKVNSGDDIMISDKSCDVTLYDMCLIYVSPFKINKYLEETKRITRNYVVLCEFDSSNWFKRLLVKFQSGYNMHDYKKILTKQGFYDIIKYKLRPQDWPGGYQEKFGHIIVARVPKK